jgi:hypothetical protein
MNTNDPWKRLADSVRRRPEAPPASPAEMPFGFETRVLARLRVPRGTAIEAWARLALRAVPLGAAALLLCWMALPAQPAAEPAASDVVEQLMQEVLKP